MVLFEKRQIGKGIEIRHSVRNEIFFVTSALICLAGTCGAIYFGGRVSHLKDVDLSAYQTWAKGEIAKAQKEAGDANNAAGIANESAAVASLDNTKLRIKLTNDEEKEHQAEAALSERESIIAGRSPVSLSEEGIKEFRAYLTPYAKQHARHEKFDNNIEIDCKLNDHVALQIGESIARSIPAPTQTGNPSDLNARYEGVTIVVSSLRDVPPLARALYTGLKDAQMDVHPIVSGDVGPFRFLVQVGP